MEDNGRRLDRALLDLKTMENNGSQRKTMEDNGKQWKKVILSFA